MAMEMTRLNKIYHTNPLGFLALYYVLVGGLILIAYGAAGIYNGWHYIDFISIMVGTSLVAIYHYTLIE